VGAGGDAVASVAEEDGEVDAGGSAEDEAEHGEGLGLEEDEFAAVDADVVVGGEEQGGEDDGDGGGDIGFDFEEVFENHDDQADQDESKDEFFVDAGTDAGDEVCQVGVAVVEGTGCGLGDDGGGGGCIEGGLSGGRGNAGGASHGGVDGEQGQSQDEGFEGHPAQPWQVDVP